MSAILRGVCSENIGPSAQSSRAFCESVFRARDSAAGLRVGRAVIASPDGAAGHGDCGPWELGMGYFTGPVSESLSLPIKPQVWGCSLDRNCKDRERTRTSLPRAQGLCWLKGKITSAVLDVKDLRDASRNHLLFILSAFEHSTEPRLCSAGPRLRLKHGRRQSLTDICQLLYSILWPQPTLQCSEWCGWHLAEKDSF